MNHWHNLKPLLIEFIERRQRWQFWLIRLLSQITMHQAFCTGLRKNPYALWERDRWTITMWAYRSSLNAMPILPLCKHQDISFFQKLGSVKFSPDCSVIPWNIIDVIKIHKVTSECQFNRKCLLSQFLVLYFVNFIYCDYWILCDKFLCIWIKWT